MMQGYLLNNLLPLRLGELGRAFLLGRKINVSMFHVLSTIVIERVIDLAMAAALTILVLPRVVAMDWVKPVAYSTMTVVVIGLLSLALMARFRTSLHGWVECIAGRVALVKKYLLPILDSAAGRSLRADECARYRTDLRLDGTRPGYSVLPTTGCYCAVSCRMLPTGGRYSSSAWLRLGWRSPQRRPLWEFLKGPLSRHSSCWAFLPVKRWHMPF